MNEDTSKVITLPSAQEIMERLKNVDMGVNGYMEEKFYPMIAQEAGRELAAEGIVMMLTLKIYDFMKEGGYQAIMENILLHTYIPRIIDALVEDKEVAEKAKSLHRKAIDNSKTQ